LSKALRWTPEQLDAYRGRRNRQQAIDIDAVHKHARNKYGNKHENGFASKREARRHEVLMLRAKAREISELRCQVPFRIDVNDELVCIYKADFTYLEGGALIVEDTKGYRTPVYRLKKKLMKAVHGIDIREV
jgi:hypothetical protein